MQAERTTPGPIVSTPAAPDLSRPPSVIPLFHAAWLFALGIVLAHVAWMRPSVVLVALIPLALLCCMAAYRAQRIVWAPLAALWCLLGVWCAEMEPQPAPSREILALSDGLMRTVEGTVADAGPLRIRSRLGSRCASGPSARRGSRRR